MMKKHDSKLDNELLAKLTGADYATLQNETIGYQRFRKVCRRPGLATVHEIKVIAEALGISQTKAIDDFELGFEAVTIGPYKAILKECATA